MGNQVSLCPDLFICMKKGVDPLGHQHMIRLRMIRRLSAKWNDQARAVMDVYPATSRRNNDHVTNLRHLGRNEARKITHQNSARVRDERNRHTDRKSTRLNSSHLG